MASSYQTASASFPSSAESSSVRRWKYDVFLSFRGPDTRKSITSELYRLQNMRGIKTFMDDRDLEVGDVISPTLQSAIEESRFAIVVLSPNYASSTWCLEELTKICQCMEDNRILPLFYNVDPTDVRYQKRSFEEAFTNHEKSRRHINKVQQWRDALNKVANLSGWHTQDYKTDKELIDIIVEFVYSKVVPVEIESTENFQEFEATRQAMDKVLNVLADDQVIVVGVYGMGGVGKTTMVKHVGAQARKSRFFDQVIMAAVSQNPDLRKIQGTFADLLGLKFEEETEIGRAGRLKEKIMRETRILIILDDVWKRIEFSSIGIPSHNELQRCNCKVLLTTRRLNVCHSMESQANIPLNILSEIDSWILFEKEARKSFDKSTSFYDVASKVARECAGLPVALIVVARALRYASFEDWKEAARRLKASQLANPEDEGDVFKCIKLSYDYLKSDDSKSCFLLCCLFPEDYDIQIEDLLMYAIGKGLFQDSNMHEARATTHLVVKALKDSSLLLDSEKDGCIRMHDVIRDMAILISISHNDQQFFVKSGCELKNWPIINAHKGYSAISLMKNDIRKLPKQLVCPNLKILLLQHNADLDWIPWNFFQCPNELRVLDLSYTRICLLPQSFSLLTNLQALYLDSCRKIHYVSLLGKLTKLEILSMKNFPHNILPREIGYLTNLRMLDVSGNEIFKIPSEVISKLHRLEEFYMQCGFWWWGSKFEGQAGEETNIGLDEITGLLHLNILKVCIYDANCIPKNVKFYPNWICFDISISRHRYTSMAHPQWGHNSRSLILDTTISTLPEWFVKVVTKNTEKLWYINCKGLNNILVEYHHGKLHMLKHLTVSGPGENLKELMNPITWVPTKSVFQNLEELCLEYLEGLEELCTGELPPRSLFNLKVLKVEHCHNLGKVLLPSKLLQRLPNLEKLTCRYMHGMKYVFGCEWFELEQSKLEEMKLLSLRALRSICNGPAPPALFQTLKSLFIIECDIQGSLFTSDAAQCLLQLEDLFVTSCPNLDRVIEANKETVNNKKIVLPKLNILYLENLPMLYKGSSTVDIECPSLEHLHVRNCPWFSFFTSASDFHSRNQVQFNDEQNYTFLFGRLHNWK